MKKKVWIFIPTLGGGGAEKMVLDLASGINKDKFEITLFSLYDESEAVPERIEYAEKNNINVKYLHKKRGFDIVLLLKLIRMVSKEKPDVLHSHLGSFQYISIVARLLNTRHIHTMHSIGGKEHKIYAYLLKQAYRNPEFYMVSLSDRIHHELAEMYPELGERLVTVFNGIDVIHFLSEKESRNEDTTEFICVANLTPVKNHEMLLRCFKQIITKDSNAHLTLVGDGSCRTKLEEQVKSENLCEYVTFTGRLNDPADNLKNSDIFVLASHYEGMPLSVIEAMAAGLPIIAPRVGGLDNLVKNNGILFKVDDQMALINAMWLLMTDFSLWESCHRESCCRAKMFDVSNMVKQYELLYQ